MYATIDYRVRPRTVTLKMSLDEFRDTVRWLEELDPQDKATHEWRAELDHIDPLPNDAAELDRWMEDIGDHPELDTDDRELDARREDGR